MPKRLAGAAANVVASSAMWTPTTRTRILRLLGARIAEGTRIYPGIRFIGRVDQFSVGRQTFVNAGVTIGSNAAVTIGERVAIGPGVQLLPTTHEIGPSTARAGKQKSAAITVSDGVWVGASAVILSGVTVGPGTIIAAGAVVTADCEPNSVYGGVPARKLSELTNSDRDPAGSPGC